MQSGPWTEAVLLWRPFKIIGPILSKLRRNCKRAFKAPQASGSFELQEPEERAGGVDAAALERDGDVAGQGRGDLIVVLEIERLAGAGLRLRLEPGAAHQRHGGVEARGIGARAAFLFYPCVDH